MATVDIAAAVGGGYGEFRRCRARYRVLKGGKASKKSSTTALWYIYHLMKYPGANLMVVRQVYNTHRDSTFAQLRWAIRRLQVEPLWRCTLNPLEMEYRPTGQRILFRGFDKADKLASTTVEQGVLCWVWVEEAFELPSEREFDKLDLSMPRGQIPAPLFKQTTLTFNPWSGRHWLKQRFFDREAPDVAVFSTDYRCNEFLDDVDRARYEQMRETQPRLYAVAGRGEWGLSEGLVYDNWETAEFDPEALRRDERFCHVFGLDYGYTNDPTAFIAMAADPVRHLLFVYDEHYEKRMLNSDIAAMLRRKGYAGCRIRADSAEPKSNDDLRRLGIRRICPAVKGRDSVQNGIANLQQYRITVHPRCMHTAAELSSYAWEAREDGSGRSRPADRDNHLMDAMRYAAADIRYFHPSDGREPEPSGERLLCGRWNG